MKKVKKVKGFVMNKKTGHTSYVFKQEYDLINSLGFTHNKNDISDKKKLKHNINPNDNSNCYVKTKIERQRFNTYREKDKYKDYRIHKEDRSLISELIKKDKKRR